MRRIPYELLVLKQASPFIEFEDYFLAQEVTAARLSAAVKAFSKFVLRIEAGEIFDSWHLIKSRYTSPALLTFCDESRYYIFIR